MIGNRNHHQPNHQNWQFKIRAALISDHPITRSIAITRSRSVSSAFISGKKLGLCDRFQHVRGGGVIAKRLAYMDEEIFVPRRKHKAAA
jgi:hypothetical protein